MLDLTPGQVMVDLQRNESTDTVTLLEAQKRSHIISTDELKYFYRLALRMGDNFLGEATVKFRAKAAPEDVFLNVSVLALGEVVFNGTPLSEDLYARHRLTLPAELIKPENILRFRYVGEYAK